MYFTNKTAGVLFLVLGAFLSGCSDSSKDSAAANSSSASSEKVIRFGFCPGPYSRMVSDFFEKELNRQGYKVEYVEFTDYVQPDSALDSGNIDANLMQHQSYLDSIIKTQGFKITGVVNVPTLGLGVFSEKYRTFDEVPEGSKVGIPTDAVNLARALRIARDLGYITLKAEKDEQKASVADIDQNPKNLEFVPLEAAQISRSLDSLALGFVPGNYAIAANLDYSKALGVESVFENIKNVVAVREQDRDSLGRILQNLVKSRQFIDAVEANHYYDSFTRPAWWNEVKEQK
ncbi:MAG TPA: methionine-binding protein [Succinivibrionaceae bacterium]|nr:methionine-binding protein [Succinivibrionaceae bacterium]